MTEKFPEFFLASNSCEGFVSNFKDSFDAKDGWSAYIIKGGPGSGKSSFMRHFAFHAKEKGEEVILCPCTSDPNSLDGIILPGKKIVMLDGTKPHTVEPVWPGVCEEIVYLGQFWDSSKIKEQSRNIFEISELNSLYHRKASCYLRVAGQILNDSIAVCARATDFKKCISYALNTVKKTVPYKSGGKPREWIRYINGITPLGVVSYTRSISDYYKTKIVVSDSCGTVSNTFMNTVRKELLDRGYEIITVGNAFLPDTLIDHILIPELSLAFVTENKICKFESDERRIHARRFMDNCILHSYRQRLNFNRKISKELIMAATETLSLAKSAHDKLEKYYIDAMDWRKATEFAEKFAAEKL